MESMQLLLGVLLLSMLVALPVCCAQPNSDCTVLQDSQLGNTSLLSTEGLLAETLQIASGEGGRPSIQILETNTVCLGQGTVRDAYRSVSVVVRYRISGDVEVIIVQVEYQCSNGEWGFNTPSLTSNPEGNLTTALRTDCALCIEPGQSPGSVSEGEHCMSCDSSCTGLMRCSGVSPNFTCCNYFAMTGSCLSACPDNSAPDNITSTCECLTGYTATGNNCSDIDDCNPNPCDNGGTCTDQINDFTCSCIPGFTGDTCATDIDDCDPNPCENGGTCTDQINNFTCSCVPGFTGDTCATDVDDCDPNPCENGGTCTDQINNFTCSCVPGFTGNTCATDIDDCDPNPCENGGTCTGMVNGFSCSCLEHWSGDLCESCSLPGCSNCSVQIDQNNTICSQCTDGLTLSESADACKCSIDNCLVCSNGFCEKCEDNHKLINLRCIPFGVNPVAAVVVAPLLVFIILTAVASLLHIVRKKYEDSCVKGKVPLATVMVEMSSSTHGNDPAQPPELEEKEGEAGSTSASEGAEKGGSAHV